MSLFQVFISELCSYFYYGEFHSCHRVRNCPGIIIISTFVPKFSSLTIILVTQTSPVYCSCHFLLVGGSHNQNNRRFIPLQGKQRAIFYFIHLRNSFCGDSDFVHVFLLKLIYRRQLWRGTIWMNSDVSIPKFTKVCFWSKGIPWIYSIQLWVSYSIGGPRKDWKWNKTISEAFSYPRYMTLMVLFLWNVNNFMYITI